MDIPVIKKTKEGIEAYLLPIEEIWYVNVENNRDVVYHTKDDKFYQPTSMEQVHAILKEQGFEKLDRGVIANIQNIQHLDTNMGKVYFEPEISQESKYATVAFSNLRKLKKYFRQAFEKKKD
ncbi:LytTR family transcriptional regulator DNA-binding domain-containing protein [Marinicrinis lubricantis]|uniref:LytTR family transcriptional regulator DNA-binding domain-containing protein n=1 Tax=Marinicrinis lubricantis TaxID=2086470 RepID=A0ABW1IT64_9BACL